MSLASAAHRLRHVFLRDMVLQASIGVHAHERGRDQRVRINVDLAVREDPGNTRDRLEAVLDYEAVAGHVRSIATAQHVNLVETLAQRIAACCLQDDRVQLVRVRVEKLDVFADTAAVGVEIERART